MQKEGRNGDKWKTNGRKKGNVKSNRFLKKKKFLKRVCALSWMWRLFWSCSVDTPAFVVIINKADLNWQRQFSGDTKWDMFLITSFSTSFCSRNLWRFTTLNLTTEKETSSIFINLELVLWLAVGLPYKKQKKHLEEAGEADLPHHSATSSFIPGQHSIDKGWKGAKQQKQRRGTIVEMQCDRTQCWTGIYTTVSTVKLLAIGTF